MTFQLKPATRIGVAPLIMLYSESGHGKTYSSLLLARGMAGPTGKVVMIDTEAGRGQLYADMIPGGYLVIDLDPPFSPARYYDAMKAVEAAGAAVGIIDSGSHEWEGEGGVLDAAAENEQKAGKPGLNVWKAPKMAHGLWVRGLLRSRIPWVVCLRAKYKSRQSKNEQGKTVIVKDDHLTPIQHEEFIFEATVHAEILADHSLRLTKWSHPSLKTCFPAGPITIETGETLARWCSVATPAASAPVSSLTGPSTPARPSAPAGPAPPAPKLETPKMTPQEKVARWVKRVTAAGGGKPDYALQWAVANGILLDTEALDDWPLEKLPKTVPEVDKIFFEIAKLAGIDDSPTP